jgi:tetratricopeptide (TPR) repeat protein
MDLREQLQTSLGVAYTLGRELGGGGMSRVFVAHEARFDRKVVVKVLSPELAEGISAERFGREIKLAASLQQANIVPLLDAGDADGLPFYTMPFVDGESLRARLASGPLPITQAVSILRDVARALAYAHERGVVHRDIKPDNVLLSRGTAVVTDFGIAKALAASWTSPGATLTMDGVALGTPAYMAPEQAAGDPATDARSDVYAFGCMAYELLSGKPPFVQPTLHQLVTAHMTEIPRPVAELRPETPPMLAALVMRCLAKNPADRPANADALVTALDTIPTGDAAVPLLRARRSLSAALIVYVIAFAAVALGAKIAIPRIGLPEWVFPGALITMGLGLPVILLTALRAGSWRRTMIGGVYAVGAFVVIVAAFMLLRSLGIGPAASLFAAGRLHERDRLIVTDFRVKGADSSLGNVVSEAVRTELGQSKVLNVLSPTAVAGALERMQRAPSTPVDLVLAREVAKREGAKAVVDGDITPLGNGFVVAMRLVSADSGVELAGFHETANDAKDLLPTIDHLARALRGKIGESLKSVHADPPLEQVTTPSLAALRKFVEGKRANNFEVDYEKALRLMREAIALDTGFAMAYRNVGIVLGNLDYPESMVDSAYAKAYQYRDRLTERERYLTEMTYFQGPARDRGKAARVYEEYLTIYPHDYAALNNVGEIYESRRQFARADSAYRRSIAESPSVLAYGNLIVALLGEGRIDEADSLDNWADQHLPRGGLVQGVKNQILLARGELDSAEAGMRRNTTALRNPQARARQTEALAMLWILRGRLAAARKGLAEHRAMNVSRTGEQRPIAAAIDEGMIDAWFLQRNTLAVARLDSALAAAKLPPPALDQSTYLDAAIVYALAGRPDRARAMIAKLDEITDTTIKRSLQTGRHRAMAEIAIAERRPRDAIVEIRQADSLPDGPSDDCARCTYAALGRAFDLAGVADSARFWFERYLETPLWRRTEPRADPQYLAGVYKRLGELYEAKSDKQKAASYYTKFIELWKNADPELQPRVAEVRRALARLDVEAGSRR